MKQEEKILAEMYLYNEKAEREARKNKANILRELAKFAPHKVGDVVKWTERKKRNAGTWLYPSYVMLPPVEKKAVLSKIEVSVWKCGDKDAEWSYHYEFRAFKKDGGLSQIGCHPNSDTVEGVEWTGEVYDLNKE